MTSNNLFPVGVSENEFFSDLARAKLIVDHGIRDFFILLDPICFRNVKPIGNTTIKDCVDVFGLGYVLMFRFAGYFPCEDDGSEHEDWEEYQSFSIRPLTNSDKKKLRGQMTFFPTGTWVVDWRSGKLQMLLPFVQDDKTAEIKWLFMDKAYCPDADPNAFNNSLPAPCVYLKSFIEVLPDYFDCNLAICKYKGVDMLIPIAPGTAKMTFRNRDRDELGVKRRIVHTVKAHERVNSMAGVERHLRGRSDITIRGEQITISSPLEWSNDRYIAKALEKSSKKRKR